MQNLSYQGCSTTKLKNIVKFVEIIGVLINLQGLKCVIFKNIEDMFLRYLKKYHLKIMQTSQDVD